MTRQPARDTIASLARDLAHRILWESELGGEGYSAAVISGETTNAPAGHGAALPPEGLAVEAPATLESLRDAIGDCDRCGLARGRTHLVFGEGNPIADLVFVGEGPGRDEDLAGRPFVGAAGQLLDRIIQAMTLSREKIYICNVVKCRPPNNRVPDPEEQGTCGRFLRSQLSLIRPKVVVALGSTAAHYLLDTDRPISALRGRFHEVGDYQIMPTYHPAYLLRNPSGKRAVWEDMKKVMAHLGLVAGNGAGG
jgi:uracil-DNA glycosylase family 4